MFIVTTKDGLFIEEVKTEKHAKALCRLWKSKGWVYHYVKDKVKYAKRNKNGE